MEKPWGIKMNAPFPVSVYGKGAFIYKVRNIRTPDRPNEDCGRKADVWGSLVLYGSAEPSH